ncbi:DUF5131 family protein [Methylomonas sp. AM2-LC]|uniref:DUF5131 family protein n=1 Tax=Methylomonas sp. AM2-LC TaxID=3153301 RepID=UPI003264765C
MQNEKTILNEEWNPLENFMTPAILNVPIFCGEPRIIHVSKSHDLFGEDVLDEFLPEVFAVIADTPQHQFLIKTIFPERMRAVLRDDVFFEAVLSQAKSAYGLDLCFKDWPLKNVWIGVEINDQKTAQERIPLLMQTPAAIRWVSVQPLLGPLDLRRIDGGYPWIGGNRGDGGKFNGIIDWVVVSGEHGEDAKPMHPDWAFSLRDQCEEAVIPLNFESWGEWCSAGGDGFGTHPGQFAWINSQGEFLDSPPQDEDADCITVKRVGKDVTGRILGGRVYNEYPVSIVSK